MSAKERMDCPKTEVHCFTIVQKNAFTWLHDYMLPKYPISILVIRASMQSLMQYTVSVHCAAILCRKI